MMPKIIAGSFRHPFAAEIDSGNERSRIECKSTLFGKKFTKASGLHIQLYHAVLHKNLISTLFSKQNNLSSRKLMFFP